jgi:hypothetical protein
METIIQKERRLLAHLSQALVLAETGQMPMREVEGRRHDLREFYAEVFGASMLAKREKLRAEVLGR